MKDKLGRTALSEATRNKKREVVAILEAAMREASAATPSGAADAGAASGVADMKISEAAAATAAAAVAPTPAASAPPTTAIAAAGGPLTKDERLVARKTESARVRAIADAKAICNDDIRQYSLVWEEQVRLHAPDIAAVAAAVDAIEARLPPGEPRQPANVMGETDTTSSDYLAALNIEFEDVEGGLYDAVRALAASMGFELRVGPAKRDERSSEKAQLAYGNDYARIKDLRRASVVGPDLASIARFVERLGSDAAVTILRAKNRFQMTYNANERSAGYRDLQFNLQAPRTGLVWELQVHLAAIERLKTQLTASTDASGRTGHGRYKAYREIMERL